MFNMKQVGKRIVTMRKERNMTQTELADKMDVSFQAVSNWERGISMPDISKLPELAALFGCTVDEILNEKSELLHSAMSDSLQEYAENNEISREELEAAVPIFKPAHVEELANGSLLKNGDSIEVFYPYLDEDTLREVARRRIDKGESIADMLDFLDEEDVGKFAFEQYERGKPVAEYYDFMEDEQLAELARQKIRKGESIADMLDFLDEKDVGKFAYEQYERGKPVAEYYDYMEDGQLEALAKRKIKSRESIADMLDYLDSDILKRVMQELLG